MFHFHLTLLNDMKKIIITIISFCYSVSSFCQAWAMDEAADHARESEPITIGSIISFLVFAGIIYFIYAIISSFNESREKKRKEKFDKDFHERIVREKAGRYKCPICGKEHEEVVIDNHISQPDICDKCVRKIIKEWLKES